MNDYCHEIEAPGTTKISIKSNLSGAPDGQIKDFILAPSDDDWNTFIGKAFDNESALYSDGDRLVDPGKTGCQVHQLFASTQRAAHQLVSMGEEAFEQAV